MIFDIDFYSETEVSILFESSKPTEYAEEWKNALLLFTIVTLRQLSNLGDHVIAKTIVGLLMDHSTVSQLADGEYQIPDCDVLLRNGFYSFVYPSHLKEAIDNSIISAKVKLVDYRGSGSKAFHATYPPFWLSLKGFGLFGFKVNYYVFHAVAITILFLGKRYSVVPGFKSELLKICNAIGLYYRENNGVQMNQPSIAKNIFTSLGV